MSKRNTRAGVADGSSVALAFVGAFSSALALSLALLDRQTFEAMCAIVMTTYCAAEFIVRSSAEIDTKLSE